VHASHLYGAGFAYFAVAAGVFVTAFYSFRMYFLVFHGPERFRDKPFPPEAHDDHAAHDDDHGADAHISHAEPNAHADAHDSHAPPHESPGVVTWPLILLAIPSVVIGFMTIGPMLFGDFFKDSIAVDGAAHPAMEELAGEWHGPMAMVAHSLTGPVLWLAVAGVVGAWFLYLKRPDIPAAIQRRFRSSTACSTTSTGSTGSTSTSCRVPPSSSARRSGGAATSA
jgi:NADH-quinone oxidoreductase subunit L